LFRGHRATLSRDSAPPSASFWRAEKTLSRQGVRLALYKISILRHTLGLLLASCCTGFSRSRDYDHAIWWCNSGRELEVRLHLLFGERIRHGEIVAGKKSSWF
jgi:hypothetical protein